MPKGKASGKNLDYQKLCHDIILQLQSDQGLIPYERDGVDITFSICGTEVTFDAVLKNQHDGKLVAIESKRYEKRPIEQRDVFAFWGEIEWLRRSLNTIIAGIIITKSKYRIGAIKAATALGIKVAVCESGQNSQEFAITYFRYDPSLSRPPKGVAKDVIMKVPTASYIVSGMTASMVAKYVASG